MQYNTVRHVHDTDTEAVTSLLGNAHTTVYSRWFFGRCLRLFFWLFLWRRFGFLWRRAALLGRQRAVPGLPVLQLKLVGLLCGTHGETKWLNSQGQARHEGTREEGTAYYGCHKHPC